MNPPLASVIAGDIEEVDGIAWCAVHDAFAIEGFDYSDHCYTEHWDGASDPDRCDLRPLYREVGER